MMTAIAFGGLTWASCTKDNSDDANPGSENAKIAGQWKLISGALDENENDIKDSDENTTPPAGYSMLLDLNSNGTGLLTEKDGSYITYDTLASWGLTNNAQTLHVVYPDGEVADIGITILTSGNLELKYKEPGEYTTWLYFKKQ